MENIESLLKQILNKQDTMQNDVNDIKIDISVMKNDIDTMKVDISNNTKDISDIKTKLSSVIEQTADLTEFKIQTEQNFSDIKDSLDFILHKEAYNEKEIYKLKQVNYKQNKMS